MGSSGAQSTVARRMTNGVSPFDMPVSLPLAFALALHEMILNRGMGVLVSQYLPRGALTGLSSVLVFLGLFVNYMSTLLCLVLLVHVVWDLVRRSGFLAWPRRVTMSLMASVAGASVLALLLSSFLFGGGHSDRILNLLVTAQLSITGLGLLFAFTVLATPTGRVKRIFATIPVLILLVMLTPQFFHFYPLSRPGWLAVAHMDLLMVVGHVLGLVFPFPVAFYLAYQHMKHGLPVFIHVLVALSGFFLSLMLVHLPSGMLRDVFMAMLGMQPVLPAPTVLYTLAVLPLLFIFSTLVGTPVASRDFLISRRRAGMGLALVYLGTFTPLTAPQASFLALGLLLWMKSIILD